MIVASVDILNLLEGSLLPRNCVTYVHDGDMLGKNDSTSRDSEKLWNNLNAAAYVIRRMNEFWMTEATFDELLVLV